MESKVLVTGSSGFTGKILVRILKKKKFKVITLDCDITKKNELENFFRNIDFDFVIHLAAISNVAFPDPNKINHVNVKGTKNLLSMLNDKDKPPKLVIVPSSAYVYGVTDDYILNENSKIDPSNIYGQSKLEVEKLCKIYKNFPILVSRPFNYTGVGQSETFLIPKIVNHFKLRKKEIELGNTEIIREFNDVRDVCEIYVKLIKNIRFSDTINICSNRGYSIKEIIQICNKLTGHEIDIKVNDNLKRKNDIPVIIGDTTKMLSLISKHKFRNFENTLKWMLLEDKNF